MMRRQYQRTLSGIKRIQKVVRTRNDRRRELRKKAAAKAVLVWWRDIKRQKCNINATRIQSCFRGLLVRKQNLIQLRRHAILKLQSIWRSFICCKFKDNCLKSVKKIQSAFRLYKRYSLLLKNERENMNKHHMLKISASRKISTYLFSLISKRRMVSAAKKLSRWYLSRLPLVRVRKLIGGFKRLQAVVRANRVREACTERAKACLVKIRQANLRALADSSLQLGKLTTKALGIVQSGRMISQLIKACQTIELSTSLSHRCCKEFAASDATNVLLGLVRSCNRSTPHQELLRYTV
jgi:abnormal spindle-like microcephaly-associated protein